jgi:anti-sigma factor RsiW
MPVMRCEEASHWMHEYLDGTLTGSSLTQLKDHITECAECQQRLERLEETEVFVQMLPAPAEPSGLANRVMHALPRPSRRTAFKRWVKLHPAASVAVVFLLVMMSSFLSLWDKESNLVVKGADLEDVIIQGDRVIIPQGSIIDGDITIENGKLQVEGIITGNLTIIDGSYYLASTASIAGNVTDINQTIDYFWFRVKEFFSGFVR